MKKLISFSLFGKDPKYLVGAVRNLELQQEIYPGWTCRFYTSSNVPKETVRLLQDNGAEIVPMKESFLDIIVNRCWRLLALEEKDLEAVIIRDADSRLNLREKRMVDEWLASGKACHIIRDCPYLLKWPIMNNSWGMRGGYLPMQKLQKKLGFMRYRNDEHFLTDKIYPLIKDDVLIHSSYMRFPGETVISSPPDTYFVGQAYAPGHDVRPCKIQKRPHYIEPVGRGDYSLGSLYKYLKSEFEKVPEGGRLIPLPTPNKRPFFFYLVLIMFRLLKPIVPRKLRDKTRAFKFKFTGLRSSV